MMFHSTERKHTGQGSFFLTIIISQAGLLAFKLLELVILLVLAFAMHVPSVTFASPGTSIATSLQATLQLLLHFCVFERNVKEFVLAACPWWRKILPVLWGMRAFEGYSSNRGHKGTDFQTRQGSALSAWAVFPPTPEATYLSNQFPSIFPSFLAAVLRVQISTLKGLFQCLEQKHYLLENN